MAATWSHWGTEDTDRCGLFNSEVHPGSMAGCGGPGCKMGIICNEPEKEKKKWIEKEVRIKVKGVKEEEQSPGILRKQQESDAVVPFGRPRKEVCSPSHRFEINLGNTVRPSKRGRG